MPQLVKLQNDYRDQGFTVIAAHVQAATKEEVVNYLRSVKASFSVTDGGSIDAPNTLDGIPAAYLFDSRGNLVEAGRPADMKHTIVELIKSEPHFLTEGRTFKEMTKYVSLLKRSEAYGKMLNELKGEVDREGRAGKEARFLVKKIRDYGKKKYAHARKLESENALKAVELYNEIAAKWKGVDIGDRSSERLAALRKDETFQEELKASKLAAQILAECETLVAYGSRKPVLTSGPNRKIAAKVKGYASVLFRKYPDSPATARVKEELKTYGFEF